MEKQRTHRYEIWTAATKEQLWPSRPDPFVRPNLPQRQQRQEKKHILRQTKPAAKTDDLDTTLLLYGYGLPIELALEGICTLPNGLSAKCRTTKISSDSVDVVYSEGCMDDDDEGLAAGTAIDLELVDVGALRGILTGQNKEGFQVTVDSAYKSILGAKLNHLASERGLVPPPVVEVPSDVRIEPTYKDCWFLDHTSTLRKGKIIHISQIDVLIKAVLTPPIGAKIVFRGPHRYSGEITSSFKLGFLVKFCLPIPSKEFSAAIKFADL